MFRSPGFSQQLQHQNTLAQGSTGNGQTVVVNINGQVNVVVNMNGQQVERENEQDGAGDIKANLIVNMNIQQAKRVKEQEQGDSKEKRIDKTALIINYIPQFTTEEELSEIFSQVGRIESIRIRRDCITGYNYGYGFIEYTKPEFASTAIEKFNGLNFRNKHLKVSYSRPPGQDMKDSNLYIANLPKKFTEENIDKMFGNYGEIIQRRLLKDKITGSSRGVAFVRYSKIEEAQAAIAALDGKQLGNAMLPLRIHIAEGHASQKAHYLNYINHVCQFNARAFEACRDGGVPSRGIHMPRGNNMVHGSCPYANF